MFQSPDSQARPADVLSIRDVLVLVLAGAALGVGFNALKLQADPLEGLSWLRRERAVVQLDLESHMPPATAETAASASSAADATTAADPAPRASAASPGRDAAMAASPEGANRPGGTAKLPASSPPQRPGATPASAPPAAVPATTAAPAPVAGDVPVIPESRDPIEAGVDVVRKLYAASAAVFVDARSAEEYAESHIAGAINLPFDDVFKNPALARALDTKGRPVVTYCGGGDCELSRSLAFSLIDSGQRRVLVFKDGLPAWQSAGLAVHKGAQP